MSAWIEKKDKQGRQVVLRPVQREDASMLVPYLQQISQETPFLSREPEECCITLEEEEDFIQRIIDGPKEQMMIILVEGEHAGNCALASCGSFKRFAHRCSLGIGLYQKYWGAGIGKIMMQGILDEAERLGYEQVELEVVATNERAIGLYQSFGFEVCGILPRNVKYRDGSYADVWRMVKVMK